MDSIDEYFSSIYCDETDEKFKEAIINNIIFIKHNKLFKIIKIYESYYPVRLNSSLITRYLRLEREINIDKIIK